MKLRKILGHLNHLGIDTRILLGALIATSGLWSFAELADNLDEAEVRTLDESLLLALRNSEQLSDPIGPIWLEVAMRDLSALGGIAVLTLLVVAVCGFLLIQRKVHSVLLVVSSALGGMAISQILKALFGRARPDVVPHLTPVETASFPSGHSMLSAVVFLTLGALLAELTEGRRLKVYIISIALCLAFLVGVSRVYLGVHYPTDVLAGWCIGLVWSVTCGSIALALRNRGVVRQGLTRSD